MKCCTETGGPSYFVPGITDCHTTLQKCLQGNGINPPPFPGGRIWPRNGDPRCTWLPPPGYDPPLPVGGFPIPL
jgi:hypothetical protein